MPTPMPIPTHMPMPTPMHMPLDMYLTYTYICFNIAKRLCFNMHAFQYRNYHFIHTYMYFYVYRDSYIPLWVATKHKALSPLLGPFLHLIQLLPRWAMDLAGMEPCSPLVVVEALD